VKTTVEITDSLFAEVKKYAAAHGLTFRELIETSLRRTLEKQTASKKPFRLRKVTFKGKGQRIHDWETIRALIHEGRGG
jgi:Arc/MetJ family transcription regulator